MTSDLVSTTGAIEEGCIQSSPSNACSTLTASLALVSKYGMLPLDWQKVMARFDEIILLFSSTSILFPMTTYMITISIECPGQMEALCFSAGTECSG